ncbi:MAG: hypothetical protein ACSHX9_03755 [Luteolibacter sp.]
MLSKKFALKPALLGGLCLLSAFLLAWFSPAEGVMGLFGMGVRDGSLVAVKTKVRVREDAEGREVRSVAEEYMMKAERGMTVDEVRWVVEDFLALGLDVEYPEDTTAEGYLALRKAREEWYLGALVSGLRLTKEQERDARDAMGVLREKDYAEFVGYLDGLKSFEHEGKAMMVIDGGKVRKLTDAGSWMKDEGYRPWELCELGDDQLAVTNFHNESMEESDSEKFKDWLIGDAEVKENNTELKVPKDLTKNIGDLYALGLMSWGHMESIFPYSGVQVEKLLGEGEGSRKASMLKFATALQPEQLKLYLLFDSGDAKSLLSALDWRSR